MLIKSMADQVNDKKLEGISDIRDETDRTGMRIVIELKRDANPQVVLNRLFTQTQLQTSFAINMLALVNNQKQPKILSLRHILDEYLAYQEQVITRRTQYDLKKAREREHLLQGLLIAQDNIDEVIHIIRTSYDDAKEKLMARFDLSDIQAQAILEMRLKALQGLDREKLQNEYDELEKKIAYFVELLSNETMLKGVLKDELIEIRDKYGDERKTEIQDVEDEIDIEDLIEEEQCVFTLTQNGYIKRTGVSEYAAQGKGGMGKKGITTREEDTVVDVFTASTHDYILFFTDTGKVYRKKGYQIPESGKAAKGTNIVNIIQVETGERVQAMLHFREKGDEKLYLTMVTRNGTVKRLPVETLKNLRRATSLWRSARRTAASASSSPRTTAWPASLTRPTSAPWAAPPSACAASVCVRATTSSAPPAHRRASRSFPSPRTASARRRRSRNTASPTAAASASRTIWSPKRPAASWASRSWTAARTCSSSPAPAF